MISVTNSFYSIAVFSFLCITVHERNLPASPIIFKQYCFESDDTLHPIPYKRHYGDYGYSVSCTAVHCDIL